MKLSAACFAFLLVCLGITVAATHVALFPSSGCFSHDLQMKEVGGEFEAANISWIQIYMYDFGFGVARIPAEWRRIVMNEADDEGNAMIREGGTLLWSMNVPVDQDRLWDLRGSILFFKLIQRNQRLCSKLLRSAEFREFKERNNVDLVVVDHFIQECFTSLASLLNATTIQFSNWPISDGYVSALNIPAPPSAVPKTGTAFSSLEMAFFDRLRNTIFHMFITLARSVQTLIINHFYSKHGYTLDLYDVEANHVLYAGRSEFLAEPIRPISNRIKHFGSANVGSVEDYRILAPRNASSARIEIEKIESRAPLNGSLHVVVDCDDSKNRTSTLLVDSVDSSVAEMEAELRYRRLSNEFPEIDFHRFETTPFVLVSFGTVAQLQNMPETLLMEFLLRFSELPYTFLWQTNSPIERIPKTIKIPSNVILVPWAPIKNLLAHRNLRFVICHGGVNTVNELLLFGIPVVGVPLQGDQSSNLQRLVDFGSAVLIDTKTVAAGGLKAKFQELEVNYERYRTRAELFSRMIHFHRDFTRGSQKFWLNWARRNGEKVRGRRLLDLRYRGSLEHFAVVEGVVAVTILLTAISFLSF